MLNDFRGKAVLITGGTQGIGLACGLAFGKQGAHCYLTYRWGSADEDEVRERFAALGAPEPQLIRADAKDPEDTAALLHEIRKHHQRIEVLVAGVAAANVVSNVRDYNFRALMQSIEVSSWPLFAYLQQIKERFSAYPRYAIGLSSDGPDHYLCNYDYVAASKAVMETLCRYASFHLFDEDVRINVVRTRYVHTESLHAVLGDDIQAFLDEHYREASIPVEDVSGAVLALCSGLLDAVRGQVLMIDRGTAFCDNLMRMYDQFSREHSEEVP